MNNSDKHFQNHDLHDPTYCSKDASNTNQIKYEDTSRNDFFILFLIWGFALSPNKKIKDLPITILQKNVFPTLFTIIRQS